MGLGALPASNTARYFLDYSVQSVNHVLVMRVVDGVDDADASGALDGFLTQIAPNCSEITINGLRFAAKGSDVTNPVSTGSLEASYGTLTADPINKPLQATFTGRSSDGRRGRVGLFGIAAQTDASWRVTTTEDSDVGNTIDALGTFSAAGFFVSITGLRLRFHPYMNLGFNDHFVDKARGG